MTRYRFLTTWCLESPIQPVWDAIFEVEHWPSWWKGVERVVELEPGGENRVGALHRYTWKSRLPYELEFEMRVTRVEAPYFMEGAADGELRGTGRWRLYEGPAGTAVTYEWDVETTSRWMNLLAPLARPAFAWNHDVVMRHGGEGLARVVGGPLVVLG